MSASALGDQSWQSILDLLTSKAKKDGLLASVKNAKGFEAKINKVRDSIFIRLRDEGNLKFHNHDYQGALKVYEQSVICAPEYGPELSLAYGNRSATLYHLTHYPDCLQDIDLALKYRYPKNLEYKLHQRKGQCLNKLGRHSEAIKSFEQALDTLKFIQKLTEAKKHSLVKDLQALIKETKALTTADEQNKDKVQVQANDEGSFPPEVPSLGLHPTISGGSSCLDLKKDDLKGRYVVTNKEAKIGDVLFSENPYSSVLLPEHYASHCHHCYKSLLVAVPCLKCTQPRYCSETCRIRSWTRIGIVRMEGKHVDHQTKTTYVLEIGSRYHQFECGNLDLLHSVGIAHLAQRTVLLCGYEKLCNHRSEIKKNNLTTNFSSVGLDGAVDRYPDVFNLLSHVDDLEPEDLFQYAVTAMLLTSSLERRTKFFSSKAQLDSMISSLNLNRNSSEAEPVDEDSVVFIGSIILRHITQLVCNASAIYQVGQCPSSTSMDSVEGSAVVDNNQYRIAVALYPGASLMNHSCDPNVINSFYGSRIIIRAIKDLKPEAEVLNCYGPHFRRHPFASRQEMLKSQYHFECDCAACSEKDYREFEDRFSALKCHYCEGPIKNPSSESSLEHSLPCYDCGKEQSYSDRIEAVFLAYDLYKRGMESLQIGSLSEAVPALQSCYQIRREAMYAHHREVTEVADQLARCFCLMGQYREAAQFLRACLPAIQERFGPHSIEYGHELVKYTDVLLCEVADRKTSHVEQKLSDCRSFLKDASDIFELHYGSWHPSYTEIIQKLNSPPFCQT